VQSSEQSSAASSPEPKLVVAVAHGRAPGRGTPSERHGGGVLRGGHRRCTAPLASLRHPATIAGGRARPGPSRFRALGPGVEHLLSGNAAWRRCTGRWMSQRSALLSTPLCTRPTCWRHATSAPATAKEEEGAGAGEAARICSSLPTVFAFWACIHAANSRVAGLSWARSRCHPPPIPGVRIQTSVWLPDVRNLSPMRRQAAGHGHGSTVF
jgi:hypothetical protein